MSSITIVNGTDEFIRVAIFKKPYIQPTLQTIAWKTVAPPPEGGQTLVQIPSNYQVFASYSDDPVERENPNLGSRTKIIDFDEQTTRFVVDSDSTTDGQQQVADISQSFQDLVLNEVRIDNQGGFGVWGHVLKDNQDIYAPQVVSPGRVLMEDVRSPLYLAIIDEFVFDGARLVEEEISLTQTRVLEGMTALVTGSKWTGFAIAEA